jgi:hypothetical protein
MHIIGTTKKMGIGNSYPQQTKSSKADMLSPSKVFPEEFWILKEEMLSTMLIFANRTITEVTIKFGSLNQLIEILIYIFSKFK